MQKPSLLLVEDDDAVRFGFACYFSKKNFAVAEASCLSEARIQIQLRHFDAVLLDINLPDGTGLDFLTEIRARSVQTMVLIITANADPLECSKRGAQFVFLKPVSMELVHASLLKLLSKSR